MQNNKGTAYYGVRNAFYMLLISASLVYSDWQCCHNLYVPSLYPGPNIMRRTISQRIRFCHHRLL